MRASCDAPSVTTATAAFDDFARSRVGHFNDAREVFAAKITFARTACGYRCGLSAKFADRKAYFVFYSVGCLVYFVRHVLSFPMIERSPDYTTAGALWLVFRRGPAFAFGHYTRYGLFWRFAFAQFNADCFDLDAAPKGGQQQGQQGVGQFAPVVQQVGGVLQAFDVFRLERFGLGFVYFLRDFQNIAQGFGQLFDQAKDFGAVFFVRAGSFDGLFNIAYDAHCYNSFKNAGLRPARC
ncbi:hypothetical protein vBPA16b_032 [Pseudomonas phage vB_PaeS_PA16b]|nr:hypothetical protein vBPA16b_032 [Pseudomonas phage vB_PA16b]